MAAGRAHGGGRCSPRFGTLDIVVANSGVASRTQTVWDMDVEHWHRVIGVDLHGVFYTCKATAKHLVDQRRGAIILVSSIGADVCAPLGAPYYVAKAGVNALTKSLAKECAPAGVRVNCIAPGLIETDMGSRHDEALRRGDPERHPARPAGTAARTSAAPRSTWPATTAASSPARSCASTAARGCERDRRSLASDARTS